MDKTSKIFFAIFNELVVFKQGKCWISNLDDLSKKFQQFRLIHLEDNMKDDNKWRQSKFIVKQREEDPQKLLEDQRNCKTTTTSI